jgi:hypothetical protein
MVNTTRRSWVNSLSALALSVIGGQAIAPFALAATPAITPSRPTEKTIECEILVIGGGLSGAAAAYEGLLHGKTVCLTEITDWLGGQISSQGTSALDEQSTQRAKLIYPRGYLELRKRLEDHYGKLNPGDCWVSESCFLPEDGGNLLLAQLQDAAKKGGGTLKWFPSTVIKELKIKAVPNAGSGLQIVSAIAIQHSPAKNAPPLNTYPLSKTLEDAYRYENSALFDKTLLRFVPQTHGQTPSTKQPSDWYVIEATETGEIIALADVPYRLGIDPRSYLEPSSSSSQQEPYCTQGFTYPFAMKATADPQPQTKPAYYDRYAPYFSYEAQRLASFDLLFTYRRIWSPQPGEPTKFGTIGFTKPTPGDISMQNWTWGNDYRPGTAKDNLIYTREQLQKIGQLKPGGWRGGLRTDTLRKGEENSLSFYYWLVAGTTDSRLGNGVKQPNLNNKLLKGLKSPMGTEHGLSKYPYIRESRRIIGRPSYGDDFAINEIDISRRNYQDDYYRQTLSPDAYRQLQATLAGLEGLDVLSGQISPDAVLRRKRSTIYPDSVGIGHYAIDFHPCMTQSPPEKPGNTERVGERRGAGKSYPFQIPLRALIPQKIDNLLVTGKSIAVSHIAAAAYRVHSFEWSAGAAAGTTAAFALNHQILPYQLVDKSPMISEKRLLNLRQLLDSEGNPTAFPDTSIFNDQEEWK